jgi:hypothetical protein
MSKDHSIQINKQTQKNRENMGISEIIEKSTSAHLSDEMSKLINELILTQDCMNDALKCMSGIQTSHLHIEIKASTEVIKEFAQLGCITHEPSHISPYHWLMIREEVDGAILNITIAGTEMQLQQVWIETQTH